jgi:threonine dehydratase
MFAAQRRLRGMFPPSPLLNMEPLNTQLGNRVYLKAESLLPVGSFKIRGGYNKICRLKEQYGGDIEVITASSGNHGMAVALSARLTGIRATVAVPASTPAMKKACIASFGAQILEYGAVYDETFPYAYKTAEERGIYYVHSTCDADILGGQGTISLEVLEQLPGLEQIVVPLGGGGLVSGIAFAMKTLKPDVRVIAVMPEQSCVYAACRRAGRIVELEKAGSVADAVVKKTIEEYLYPYIETYVDDILTVKEDSIRRAVKTSALYAKCVVEGAGGLALAAVLEGQVDIAKKTVIVLSGGNIDQAVLTDCLSWQEE